MNGSAVTVFSELESFFRRNGLAALCERSDSTRTRRRHKLIGAFNWLLLALVAVTLTSALVAGWPSGWWLMAEGALLAVTYGVELTDDDESQTAPRFGHIVRSRARLFAASAVAWTVVGCVFLRWPLLVAIVTFSVTASVLVVLQSATIFLFLTAVPSLVRNAAQAIAQGSRGGVRVASRGMPVAFLVLVALFFSSDVWRFVASGAAWRFWCVTGLLVGLLGTVVITSVIPEWKALCALV